MRILRTESQIWGWINKRRRVVKAINEEIKIEEWEKYFSHFLGGCKRTERTE